MRMFGDQDSLPQSFFVAVLAAILLISAGPSPAATTTYTGVYAGGTIAPGNTVVLNNGATVAGDIVANGTLQFNQSLSSTLTITQTISGTGTITLTSQGTVDLMAPNLFDLTTTVSSGVLLIGSGSSGLRVGRTLVGGGSIKCGQLLVGANGDAGLLVDGGQVAAQDSWIAYTEPGTATVSSGTWTSSNMFYVGFGVSGSLYVRGGLVTDTYGYVGSGGYALVSGGTWSHASRLGIGLDGDGVLNITGGKVTSSDSELGGNYAGPSSGTALISGGTWANSGKLVVGSGGTGTLTMNGGLVIVSGSLSKNAASTINLNAGGTLQIGNGSTGGVLLGGTGSLVNNGKLIFNRSDASTYSGVLSGSGAVTKQGPGSLLLSNTNTYSGTTTVSGGVLAISSTVGLPGYGVAGRWSVAAGAGLTVGVNGLTNVAVDALVTSATATGNLASGAAVGFDTTGASTYNYANPLPVSAGSRIGLAKSGTGTLQITGSSAYTGPTLIGSGTLSIGAGGTTGWIGATSGVALSLDGVLQFNRTDDYGGFNPAISGSLGTIVISRGTAALSAVSSGTLTVGQSSGDIGTLNVTGGSVTTTSGVLGSTAGSIGTATVSRGTWANSGDLYVGYSSTGRLNVTGGYLSNAAGFLGRNAGSIGTGTVSSGTWAVGGNLTLGRSGTGGITVNGGYVSSSSGILGDRTGSVGTATVSSGTWANGGDLAVGISGTGTLNVNGGLIVVGGNLSKNAASTVNLNAGGTLQIGVGGAGGVLGVSTLTNNGTLIFNRADSYTYSGIISGSGAILKQGAGILTLTRPNTLTGPTTIQQGTVQLTHASALAASTISPLAGGVLSLTPYLQTTVGSLNPNAGGLVDVGTGMITVTNGLTPAALVTAMQTGRAAGSWTGTSGITSSAAASAIANATLRSVGWIDNGNGSLTFAYAAPGDSNLDWTVDILDAGNFMAFGKFDTGLAATWIEGDYNYDNSVDILDAADFFATSLYDTGPYNSAAGTIAAVPEPSMLGLVGIGVGMVGLISARRKPAG